MKSPSNFLRVQTRHPRFSGLSDLPVRCRSVLAFTLVELLAVLAIIVLLTAVAIPVIPSLMRSNQLGSNIDTLAGIMEQARETAISNNTFVWVAFTSPSTSSPGNGIWVAMIKSADGTESTGNTSGASIWNASVVTPDPSYPNLQLVNKIQNLPGVQIVDASAITATVTSNGTAPPNTSTTTLQESLNWTVTPAKYTDGYNASTSVFSKAVEFTPDGEAHVPTWESNIQFGMTATTGSATANSKNVVLFNLSRLTGKLTVYRS